MTDITVTHPHGKLKYSVVPSSFSLDSLDFETEPDESKTTEWRCADIGTLIRVSRFVSVSSGNARFIDGMALQRFRVRSYKRSLCGYWLADVEILKEEWGPGGQKKAIEMMETLRRLLQIRLIHIVDPDTQKKLLQETNPMHFSFLIPQILPLFGVSSLTIQAILQSKTCVDTLAMEMSIIEILDRVFRKRGMEEKQETQAIEVEKEKRAQK